MASEGHLNTRLTSKAYPIVLRNVTLEDAPAFAAILSDPRNNEYDVNVQKGMTLEMATRIITKMRESAASPTVLDADGKFVSGPGRVNLMVVHTGTAGGEEVEEVIGIGGFGDIKTLPNPEADAGAGAVIREGDVGVMLNTEFRGRGYAVEAMRLAVDFGFLPVADGGLGLDRVTTECLAENAAIVALVEKKLGWKGIRQDSHTAPGKEEMFYTVYPEEWKRDGVQ